MLNRLMRRTAAGLVSVAVVLSAAVVVTAAPALAQGNDICGPVNGQQVDCENSEIDPGDDDDGGNGDGGGGGSDTCSYQGNVVPCNHPDYGWYAGDGCYMRRAEPQPDREPPDGENPIGAWYDRTCSLQGGAGADTGAILVWLADDQVPPNPRDLAREVVARIGLRGPEIGLAPDPSGAGLVGLPVYMWTETGSTVWAGSDDPIRDSGEQAGLVVFIEARSVGITWEMGDGTEVHCPNPGTPYDPSFGATPSPTCGHVYQRPSLDQPDGKYPITATTQWHITYWSTISPVDSFSLFIESETAVTIHELQVVTS